MSAAEAAALHDRGLQLAQAGQRDAALECLDRAVQLDPRHPGYRANRAVVLVQAGRLEEAEKDVRRALMMEPRMPAALCLLGSITRRTGRLDEATAAYRRALGFDPRSADAHVGLGLVQQERGDRAGARTAFDAALASHPDHVSARYHRGLLLMELESFAAAADDFARAAALDPRHADALNARGVALTRLGRIDEAVASFDSATRMRPAFGDAYVNWGVALKDRGDLAAARPLFERALAVQPDLADATNNLGNLAFDDGDLARARELYRAALEQRPGFPDARFSLGLVALYERDFAAGWPGYEARFETTGAVSRRPPLAQPFVKSLDDARGRSVAVWTEQGVGDLILFSTLLPELAAAAARVLVAIDARLVPLYRRCLPGIEFVAPEAALAALGACELQVALGSLGSLLRPDAADFARQPRALLSAEAARVATLRSRLGPGRWIAVSWRSLQPAPRRFLERRKSFPVEHLGQLAAIPGVRLLDVQYGDVQSDREALEARHPGALTRLGDLDATNDFEGLAAALAACESVVSVCNATAHLAGALGRPTLLAYPSGHAPFHYWMPGPGGRSPWYPSVEVVSDPRWTDWARAIGEIKRRLVPIG